jgi:hypothetical protein
MCSRGASASAVTMAALLFEPRARGHAPSGLAGRDKELAPRIPTPEMQFARLAQKTALGTRKAPQK